MTEARKGEIAILSQVILWGAFPVITVGLFRQVSPILSLALSSLLAAAVFAIALSIRKQWFELKNFRALKDILGMTLINGIGYYALYFLALEYTTPGNAALIALFENITNFIFFHFCLKEHYYFREVLGYALTTGGAVLVLFSGFSESKVGDLLIVLACIIAPFGNYFMRKARMQVSSESMMFIRTLIAGVVMLIASIASESVLSVLSGFDLKTWIFLSINGVVILGYSKVMWAEGIHRISISKALALSNISPAFTIFFAYMILHQLPSERHLWSIPFLAIGMYILLIKKPSTSAVVG